MELSLSPDLLAQIDLSRWERWFFATEILEAK